MRTLAETVLRFHPSPMTVPLKIVVERHSDGYVAYPLGLARGAVVGQGDTYEAALSDVRSALVDAMPRSRWKRAVAVQLMIDETAAVATVQPDRETSRYAYWFTGLALFTMWNASTIIGATVVASSADLIHDLGLDATIPAAFLALLWPRLDEPTHRVVAVAGAAIAVVTTPFAPPGLPVILALIAVVPFLVRRQVAS